MIYETLQRQAALAQARTINDRSLQLFAALNALIARMDADGDDRGAELLLAGKQAVWERHHALLEQGR